MPRQSEPNVNNTLADLLRGMFAHTNVISENTRVITDNPSLKPDILVNSIGRSPVIIEAEYLPAATAEAEAKARLGLEVASNARMIEAAIALRYPEDMADATDLAMALKSSTLSYCVLTQEPNKVIKRFPESGWLDGSVEDFADLIRLVSIPQWAVNDATNHMQRGIERVAKILDEMDKHRPMITVEIAKLLGMVNVTQTRRMACAIIANAMVFHERIVGMHQGIWSLRQVCRSDVDNPQREMLTAWDTILKINFWPIFAVGRDLLNLLPSDYAARILRTLEHTASDVNALGVDNAHDLTGRIFQELIDDRKYLATFYTRPASAALLARLAVPKMQGVDWSSREAIGKLRIADFACGTGALLAAVYEQIAARHERTGGNPADLHSVMMDEVLYGCDVMPSAVHITGATLSGIEPAQGFGESRLYPLAYGPQRGGGVRLGSLEGLKSSSLLTLFNLSNPSRRVGSAGDDEVEAQFIAHIPDSGFDLVIMNPPFTRATNHEGAHADITNPAFAAFDATPKQQTAMGQRMNQLGKGTCYHGNAGVASAFAALAHKKLKPGGVLALVLPLSAAAGLSWQDFRKMLADDYTDLQVLSIAANGREMSFSSDTGMAECLVIARKLKPDECSENQGVFSSLSHRPQGLAHACSIAGKLMESTSIRGIEDGPYGGTPLNVGEERMGEIVTAPYHQSGENWGTVRLTDFSLAQTAYALSRSKLWLPASAGALNLAVATVLLESGVCPHYRFPMSRLS